MRILIVGEFSGFAKHLKNGFRKLGHQVTIVMQPDSFKKFKGDKDDIVFGANLTLFGKPIRGTALLLTPFRAIQIRWRLWRLYRKQRPDLIIVISSGFLTTTFFYLGTPLRFIEKQLSRGSKLIMTECGGSPASQYNHQAFYLGLGRTLRLEDERYSFLLKHCHAIIPTSYCYYEDLEAYNAYHPFDFGKVQNAIPLPITIDKACSIRSCAERKIVVFHGIIRPKDKGTPFIMEAMKRLEQEMPDRVECVCKGGMPYDEYVKLFDRIDILVDQTYGNGWGMNAIIGAVNRKCVLAPCGPENGVNMGIPDIPFVRIGPDSEQIYQTLKELVLDPGRIDEIKKASRQFAEKHCECSHIASRFLAAAGLE